MNTAGSGGHEEHCMGFTGHGDTAGNTGNYNYLDDFNVAFIKKIHKSLDRRTVSVT